MSERAVYAYPSLVIGRDHITGEFTCSCGVVITIDPREPSRCPCCQMTWQVFGAHIQRQYGAGYGSRCHTIDITLRIEGLEMRG
jgi:hypothetical protein